MREKNERKKMRREKRGEKTVKWHAKRKRQFLTELVYHLPPHDIDRVSAIWRKLDASRTVRIRENLAGRGSHAQQAQQSECFPFAVNARKVEEWD